MYRPLKLIDYIMRTKKARLSCMRKNWKKIHIFFFKIQIN